MKAARGARPAHPFAEDEAGLEEIVPEGAPRKDRGAVPGIMSCYAQRSAAEPAKALSAYGRVTDTMPVPARAARVAPTLSAYGEYVGAGSFVLRNSHFMTLTAEFRSHHLGVVRRVRIPGIDPDRTGSDGRTRKTHLEFACVSSLFLRSGGQSGNLRSRATLGSPQDTTDMTPTSILLMRHAEKSGDPTDPHLNEAGRARAQRLADYVPTTFGPPDAIFATATSKHSNRPFETVEPLANKLGVIIDATFADQDYGALAATLQSTPKYTGRQILICWHHGNIPSLARSLHVKPGDCPDPWDYLVFNLILQIEYPNGDGSHATCVTEKF